MGLIKAIGSAIGGTLKDQWLDLIKCDDMNMETLMVKQTTKTGQISKGSRPRPPRQRSFCHGR